MARQKKLIGMGLGAGLVGAMFVALKYAVRPATKSRVPDTISPSVFRTKVLHTSIGQIVYHECGSGQVPALPSQPSSCRQRVADTGRPNTGRDQATQN